MRYKFSKRQKDKIKKILYYSLILFSIWCFLAVAIQRACAVEPPSTVIGIDLGTTYSVAAVTRNGETVVIPNEQGNRITPSIVGFHAFYGERFIGDSGKNQILSNPDNTIFDAKRFIGKQFTDDSVQQDIKHVPFKVVRSGPNKPLFEVQYNNQTKQFTPEEISAMVLLKMKQTAEAYLGHEVNKVVVTVPAHFDDAQRQATKDAGKIAGLSVERIITEPTAAAIAYGLDKSQYNGQEKNIVVIDLGGGTFDVSLLTLDEGVFEVIANGGDTHLGGEDFDNNVVQYLVKQANKQLKHTDVEISASDSRTLSRLRKEAEKAKRALSSVNQVKIELENIGKSGHDISIALTRARFEQLNNKLFKHAIKKIDETIRESSLSKSDIDDVVLVGGSTRIPRFQQLVRKYFDGKSLNRGINADEAVAHGASIQAAIIGGHFSEDDQNAPIVIDATPLSLGIETVGGQMTKIIDKNTNYPTRKSKVFSTAQDGQTAVHIQVYQGERAMCADNRKIGEFLLRGISPHFKRGEPQIEVTFSIDANGIIDVTAKQGDSQNNIVISRDSYNLDEHEIEQMIREQLEFQEYDQQISRLVNAKNQLQSSVYALRNYLADIDEQDIEQQDWDELDETTTRMMDWLDDMDGAALEDVQEMQAYFDEQVQPILTKYKQYSSRDDYQEQGDQHEDEYDEHMEL